MANSPNERPPSAGPPSTEEAERLAERFRPSWELEAEPHPDPAAGGGPVASGEARAGTPGEAAVPSPVAAAPVGVARMKQTLVGMNPFLGSVASSEPPPPNAVSAPATSSAPETPQLEVRPARQRSMTLLGVAPPGMVERPDIAAAHGGPGGIPPGQPPTAPPEAWAAPPAATMKGTLLGVPVPDAVQRRPPAPVASEREEIIWEVGDDLEPAAQAPVPAEPLSPAEATPSLTLGGDESAAAPTQVAAPSLDVPATTSISASPSPAPTAATPPAASVEEALTDPSKPSGVARPYQPKQDASTPAIVVEQSVLHAGEQAAAAQRSARRARTHYSKHSATVPGNVRVVPRGPGLTPRIEVVAPDDALPERSFKAKTPLLLALMAVLIAVGVLVLFTSRKPDVTQEPLPAAPAAPAALEPATPPPPAPAPTPEKATEPVEPREPAVAAREEGAPQVTAPAPVPKAAPRVVRRQASPPARAPRKQPAAKRPATATPAPATKPKSGVIVRESPF